MKKFLVACLVLSCLMMGSALAADYYVASDGNDWGAGAGSETAPWKSVWRVKNAEFQPGDTIHFRCGDTWNDWLKIPSSGAEGQPITFSRYGNCDGNNNPILDVQNNFWLNLQIAYVHDIKVEHITVKNASYINILVSNSDNIEISNSLSIDSQNHGIQVQGSNSNITIT